MSKSSLNLAITESAYHAVLNKIFSQSLTDPLPALNYNKQIKKYEVGAYDSTDVKKLKKEYAQKNQQLIYQVGRINICIENAHLIKQINGKTLDYISGEFLIN